MGGDGYPGLRFAYPWLNASPASRPHMLRMSSHPSPRSGWGILQGALLDANADALNHGIGLVVLGAIRIFHVHAKEPAEGLPEARAERAEERLDDAV